MLPFDRRRTMRRDLKPEKVLLDDGLEANLIDFVPSKVVDVGSRVFGA